LARAAGIFDGKNRSIWKRAAKKKEERRTRNGEDEGEKKKGKAFSFLSGPMKKMA
jgi:hypothetical protein